MLTPAYDWHLTWLPLTLDVISHQTLLNQLLARLEYSRGNYNKHEPAFGSLVKGKHGPTHLTGTFGEYYMSELRAALGLLMNSRVTKFLGIFSEANCMAASLDNALNYNNPHAVFHLNLATRQFLNLVSSNETLANSY